MWPIYYSKAKMNTWPLVLNMKVKILKWSGAWTKIGTQPKNGMKQELK